MTDRPEFTGPLFEAGIAMRRKVTGDRYVDANLSKATDFTADLQKLVTELAWGSVWTRPDLALRDRSLVTVSILIAQGKLVELKTHLRGALNNGVTRAEIRELMLHAAIYAGFPACLEAFRVAGELFAEIDQG